MKPGAAITAGRAKCDAARPDGVMVMFEWSCEKPLGHDHLHRAILPFGGIIEWNDGPWFREGEGGSFTIPDALIFFPAIDALEAVS